MKQDIHEKTSLLKFYVVSLRGNSENAFKFLNLFLYFPKSKLEIISLFLKVTAPREKNNHF